MPRTGTLPRGRTDRRLDGRSQDKTQAIGMVVKNKNTLYSLTLTVCGRQKARLPKDKDPPCADAGLVPGGGSGIE